MQHGEVASDPLAVLGLDSGADEDAVRQRYLELVKRYPPERDAEKFREIHAAYQAAKDPLVIARSLLNPPDSDSPPEWSDIIDQQAARPPAISVDFLLSMGNRDKHATATTAPSDESNDA